MHRFRSGSIGSSVVVLLILITVLTAATRQANKRHDKHCGAR
jgi:hypothetical protein